MAREYFCAYHSYLKSVEPLNDAERGRLFTACLEYSLTGAVPDLRGNERFVWPTIREQIDRDAAKYNAYCEKQSGNARKRWDATASRGNSGMPDDAKHTKEKEKEKEKTKKREKSPPFIPPPGETGFGTVLQASFKAWLAYKSEKRQSYAPTGLQKLVAQIRSNAQKYGEQAVAELIDMSMANNWQGIAFDRLARQGRRGAQSGDAGRSPLGDHGHDWGLSVVDLR